MVNKLNERKNHAVLIAAVVSAFVFALSALVTGMVLGLNKRSRAESGNSVAKYLLADSANELNHTMSALRLCEREQSARYLCNDGLVFAVRAETALECDNGDWRENRAKEAFLNDVATVLHTKDAMTAVEKADLLYKYSNMFFKHVVYGESFEYDGELVQNQSSRPNDEREEKNPSAVEIEKAEEQIKTALGAEHAKKVGGYDGKIEFDLTRDGKSGYALTEDSKICEFAFEHGRGDEAEVDISTAEKLAEECAEKCGYPQLSVCGTETYGGSVTVKLCRNIDGALACDDCASAVVAGGKVVAFTAGKCECEHKVPKPRIDEATARKEAKGATGEGVLVTRTFEGKERVCYEYRYELEDGVHYVYVCAESGEQMQVK